MIGQNRFINSRITIANYLGYYQSSFDSQRLKLSQSGLLRCGPGQTCFLTDNQMLFILANVSICEEAVKAFHSDCFRGGSPILYEMSAALEDRVIKTADALNTALVLVYDSILDAFTCNGNLMFKYNLMASIVLCTTEMKGQIEHYKCFKENISLTVGRISMLSRILALGLVAKNYFEELSAHLNRGKEWPAEVEITECAEVANMAS